MALRTLKGVEERKFSILSQLWVGAGKAAKRKTLTRLCGRLTLFVACL